MCSSLDKVDTDVVLKRRLITVQRSYGRYTTKGGYAATILIAHELVPSLKESIARSLSVYVYPARDGTMMKRDVDVRRMLQRALGRAGIVTELPHVCRKQCCGYSLDAPDEDIRRCPHDDRKLWRKPHPRKMRFPDLRHTPASLLLMSGATTAAVSRIMRHSDPKLTLDVYGHLSPDYLRDEIDRLQFVDPDSAA